MEEIKCCPKCSSKSYIKSGKVKGKQRYKCKSCGYHFTVGKLGKRIENRLVIEGLRLYLEGLGFRSIERILGVSHVTVMNWVKRYGKDIEKLVHLEPEKQEEKIVEIDELCTYVKKKA